MRVMWLMAGVLLFSRGAAFAEDIAAPDVATVLVKWEQREHEQSAVEIEWRRIANADGDRFARSEAEWVPANQPNDEPAPSTLRIDRDRFLFSGRRIAAGPHGYDATQVKAITASVGAAYPERLGAPYTRALLSHFADAAAEQRPAQPFVRSFDGALLRDFWTAAGDTYPRAVLYALPQYGSADWATFRLEQDPNEQLQTLEFMAALLAMRPLHPLLEIRPEHLRIAEMAGIDGAACAVLTESPAAGDVATRTFFVDREQGVVRRYIGGTSETGVQIDIAYRDDAANGMTPTSWTVMCFAAANRPVQQYARTVVTVTATTETLTEAELTSAPPVGTWVVDQRSQQSYLVREGGARRVVTPDELRWLPTYEELAQTDSGQVGVFIEDALRRREQWGTIQWPLIVAAALLLAAATFQWRSNCRRRVES